MIEHLDGLAAAVVMVFVHRRAVKRLAERLYARQVMMDKQHKVLRREVARDLKRIEKLHEEAVSACERTEALEQSARSFHRRADRALTDPGLLRVLRRP